MVRHILFSLLRTRDDNLILVNSSLFISFFNKVDTQTLTLTKMLDFTAKDQAPQNLLNSVLSLLLVDPPFRPATIKVLVNLTKIICKNLKNPAQFLNGENMKGLKDSCNKTCANLKKIIGYNQLSEIVLNNFEKKAVTFE